jgi:Ca2+-binding RTX toxin-like protein
VLAATAGNDWMSGLTGNDRLTGGRGNDTFVFAPGTAMTRLPTSRAQGAIATSLISPRLIV